MAYNTTVSLDRLTFIDSVDFGKRQDIFGQFSWHKKKDSNYLDVKPEVLKKDDNKDFCLVQNLSMGEADFNQFMQMRNWLVIVAKNFGGEKIVPSADTNNVQ